MSESHTITVTRHPSAKIHQAICSCGWPGPVRLSEAMALVDGYEHLRLTRDEFQSEAEDSLEQDTGIPGVDPFDLWADR